MKEEWKSVRVKESTLRKLRALKFICRKESMNDLISFLADKFYEKHKNQCAFCGSSANLSFEDNLVLCPFCRELRNVIKKHRRW